MSFGGMPDLCYRSPAVYTAILENAGWLINEVGFDGFPFDFVKGYGGWMARAIQELRGLRGETAFKPFAVGECWDNSRTIEDWLNETNAWSDNPVHAFDFPLRYRLRDLCQVYGFSLRGLIEGGTVLADNPAHAVTFVENHDVLRNDPIVHDKMLAYAYILTHPGYSCVFWEGDFAYVGHMRPPEGISIGTAKECGMEKMHFRRMDEGTDEDFAVLRHVHEQTLRPCPTGCSGCCATWARTPPTTSPATTTACRRRRARCATARTRNTWSSRCCTTSANRSARSITARWSRRSCGPSSAATIT